MLMKNNITTLCYIERDHQYLMLHRVKKENDMNRDKWIGVGGHLEEGETPEECVVREVLEETGLTLLNHKHRGLLTFVSNEWGTEYIFLFTADKFEGNLKECDEGQLEWVDKDRIGELQLWEGDKVFLKLLAERKDYFSLKLCYEGDTFVSCTLQ